MNPTLLTILAFTGAFLAVFAANAVLLDLLPRDRKRVSERLDEEFRKQQRQKAKESPLFKDLSQLAQESAQENARQGAREHFKALVEQSGLKLTPGRLLVLMVATGVIMGALGLVLSRGGVLVGVPLALVGASAPLLHTLLKRRQRLEKLRAQLSDAFELMSRVLRAGQTTSQAMQAVADEFTRPIAEEFAFCYEQQNLGLPPEFALRDLARRTGLLEIKIFVLAVMVHQQTGGNLAELFDKLSAVVRDRFRIRGLIKSLTAEGRLQAIVLLGLPPVMFLVMLVINRSYATILFDYPYVLLGTAAAMAVGALWIRKIVMFDF